MSHLQRLCKLHVEQQRALDLVKHKKEGEEEEEGEQKVAQHPVQGAAQWEGWVEVGGGD